MKPTELDRWRSLAEQRLRRIEELEDTRVRELERVLNDIRDTLYGCNLSVIGWHLNGEPESMDTFFEKYGWVKKDEK
jgi:hypothetical protein